MTLKLFASILLALSTLTLNTAQASPVWANWNELKPAEPLFLGQRVELLREIGSSLIFNEGDEFVLLNSYPLEGTGATFIEIQAKKCAYPLLIADFNILEPVASPDHPVTVALDVLCKFEIFVSDSDLSSPSLLKH